MTFLRHIFFSLFGSWPHFNSNSLAELDTVVARSEKQHACQVGIAIEGTMPLWDYVKGVSCRERAWKIFSLQRLWDTEANVGILLFISLAERNVEIVADRGIAAKISSTELETLCQQIETNFKSGRYTDGISEVFNVLDQKLAGHFPRTSSSTDEIAQRVTVY